MTEAVSFSPNLNYLQSSATWASRQDRFQGLGPSQRCQPAPGCIISILKALYKFARYFHHVLCMFVPGCVRKINKRRSWKRDCCVVSELMRLHQMNSDVMSLSAIKSLSILILFGRSFCSSCSSFFGLMYVWLQFYWIIDDNLLTPQFDVTWLRFLITKSQVLSDEHIGTLSLSRVERFTVQWRHCSTRGL